jgi:hypothetical protein
MEVLLGERTSDEENQETSAVKSKCRNTGEKICPESAFLRLFNCASPASAFQHQAHSGTKLWVEETKELDVFETEIS